MKQIVNLQMSIFGAFESIGADPALVSELIPLYKNKFIPSIIQMTGIDPLNNTLKNINRLSMVSVDNRITIVFLPDRIDCNYSFGDTKAEPSTLEATFQDMCQLMEHTAQHFSIIGNRIAINGRFVTDEISLKYSDYILERPFYKTEKRCQIFLVGLSAKKVMSNAEIPLSPETNTGMLIQKIENTCCNVITYKTNLVKCLPLTEQQKLRYPNKKEIDSCFGNLLKEIRTMPPKIVFYWGKKYIPRLESI